jgi:hypothetical protein
MDIISIALLSGISSYLCTKIIIQMLGDEESELQSCAAFCSENKRRFEGGFEVNHESFYNRESML